MEIKKEIYDRFVSLYYGQNVLNTGYGNVTKLDIDSMHHDHQKNYLVLKHLSLLTDSQMIEIHQRIFGNRFKPMTIERDAHSVKVFCDNNGVMENVCVDTWYGTIVTNTYYDNESHRLSIGELITSAKNPVPYTVIDLIRSWGFILPFDSLTMEALKNSGLIKITDPVELSIQFADKVSRSISLLSSQKEQILGIDISKCRFSHEEKQCSVIGYIDTMLNGLAVEVKQIEGRSIPYNVNPKYKTSRIILDTNDKLRIKEIIKLSRIYKDIKKSVQRGIGVIELIHNMNLNKIEDCYKYNPHIYVVSNDDTPPRIIVGKLVEQYYKYYHG